MTRVRFFITVGAWYGAPANGRVQTSSNSSASRCTGKPGAERLQRFHVEDRGFDAVAVTLPRHGIAEKIDGHAAAEVRRAVAVATGPIDPDHIALVLDRTRAQQRRPGLVSA